MIDDFYNDIFSVLLKFLTLEDYINLKKIKNNNIIILLKNNDKIFKTIIDREYPNIVNKTADSYLDFLQLLNTNDYCFKCNKYLNDYYVKFVVYYPKAEDKPEIARYHKECLYVKDIFSKIQPDSLENSICLYVTARRKSHLLNAINKKNIISCQNYICPLTNDEVFGFISRNSI